MPSPSQQAKRHGSICLTVAQGGFTVEGDLEAFQGSGTWLKTWPSMVMVCIRTFPIGKEWTQRRSVGRPHATSSSNACGACGILGLV